MREDIFFLPIVARALEQSDPRAALRDAFAYIELLAREPRYGLGYHQFIRFMDSVIKSEGQQTSHHAREILFEVAERPLSIRILVERDGQPVAERSFESPSNMITVDTIEPGFYLLKLETGLLLWQGSVTEQDVLWTKAFPGTPLTMAADTDERKRRPTRIVDLSEIGLVIRFYAGVETGFMEIEMSTAEAQE